MNAASRAIPVDARPAAGEAVDAKRLAAEIIGNWPSDRTFDARRLIEDRPELAWCRSAVVDLAYEEFCRKRDAALPLDRESFAARFPAYERTLLRVLEVHDALNEAPGLVPFGADVQWPHRGETFLDFNLLVELGRGTFSRVFLAEEVPLGCRTVVVKICQSGGHEANVLGGLQHRHVGQIFSVREDPQTGLTAICMPFLTMRTLTDLIDVRFSETRSAAGSGIDGLSLTVDGTGDSVDQPSTINHQSLSELSHHAPLTTENDATYVESIARIGMQVADALAYTHEKGIVHGDVKPSNILVSDAGDATVIDFNLSMRHGAGSSLLGGTLVYMPPEQLSSIARPDADSDCRPAGDVFALGATLYESLTGRLPFGAVSPLPADRNAAIDELLARQRETALSLQADCPHVPPQLADAVERCLALDPAKRPAAGELSAMLEGLLPPVNYQPSASSETAHHPPARSYAKRLAIPGAVVCAAAVLAIAIPQWLSNPAEIDTGRSPAASIRAPDGRTLLQRADEAIGGEDYAAAADLLTRHLQSDPRNPHVLASLGYCQAQRAASAGDKAEAFRLANEAIGEFQQAIKRGFDSPESLLENIGFCRRIVNRNREPGFKPPPPEIASLDRDALFLTLAHQFADARSNPSNNKLDLNLIEYAYGKWPNELEMHTMRWRYYAHAAIAVPPDELNKRDGYLTRALDEGWELVARQGVATFELRQVARWKNSECIKEHAEYQQFLRHRNGPVVLTKPRLAAGPALAQSR